LPVPDHAKFLKEKKKPQETKSKKKGSNRNTKQKNNVKQRTTVTIHELSVKTVALQNMVRESEA